MQHSDHRIELSPGPLPPEEAGGESVLRPKTALIFLRWRRGIRFYGGLAVGVLVGYVATVGMVPALVRHTGDGGRLQWLLDAPGAVSLLEGYMWPARELSRFPVFYSAFELSCSIWWTLLDPPDTTA